MALTRAMAARQPAPDAARLPVTWEQGEHVAVVGDTGTGKTFLLTKLVPRRSHVIVIRTKLDDRKEPKFGRTFTHVRDAKAMDSIYADRLIVTPEFSRQGEVIFNVLDKAHKVGGWCVVIDELWYVERLGMRSALERLWTQGRSQGVTVVSGMQRPAWVSRFALSQGTHLFSFRVERRDLKTLTEAFSMRLRPYIDADAETCIPEHHFAYYNRPMRLVATGEANHLDRILRAPRLP